MAIATALRSLLIHGVLGVLGGGSSRQTNGVENWRPC